LGGNGFFPSSTFRDWTRQDIATRFNVARLIGGYTPGPGNMQFSFPTYNCG